MEDWKKGLDKYLASEPDDDGYNDWYESAINVIDEKLWDDNVDWFSDSPKADELFQKMFGRGPKIAGKIIERWVSIYKKD